jgi:hypothetical protein
MPPANTTSLGKDVYLPFDDLAKQFDHLEEMMRTLIDTIYDIRQQQ